MGEGEYIVLIDGVEHRYTHWDDIPQEFDNLIKFLPLIPEGPHTEVQNDAINQLPDIFRSFMRREKDACRDKNR